MPDYTVIGKLVGHYILIVSSRTHTYIDISLTLAQAAFIAIEQSEIGNSYSKGLSMKEMAANFSSWKPDTVAFSLGAFHHIHCIVS
jgi:hypothetical protein